MSYNVIPIVHPKLNRRKIISQEWLKGYRENRLEFERQTAELMDALGGGMVQPGPISAANELELANEIGIDWSVAREQG